MNQSPASTRGETWSVATPLRVAAGSEERKRKLRLVEAWTVVSALELGVRGFPHLYPRRGETAMRAVVAESLSRRSRLASTPDALVMERPPGEAATAAPGTDNPIKLLEAFLTRFSDHGLCLRWSGFDGYSACTLIFQKTRFDAGSARRATEELPGQVEALGQRLLRCAPNSRLQLAPEGRGGLLAGATGWVGELELRSPRRPGYGCKPCDRKLGHCVADVTSVIQLLRDHEAGLNLDFLVSPGFWLGPQESREPTFGYQLRLRVSAPRRPRPAVLDQISRKLLLTPFQGCPVLREYFLTPERAEMLEAVAVGAPLGPPLAGLLSPPLTSRRAASCLPWPQRYP